MHALTEIVVHTPLWVWPLFGWLVWQGLQARRDRTQALWRSLIVPAIFFIWGLRRVMDWHGAALAPSLWLVAALAFAALAWTHGPRIVAVDRAAGTITRPGSDVPLVRNVLVFCLQYAVAVVGAMNLDPNGVGTLASYAVSGATAGYFAGWAASLFSHYRATPAASPAQ